MELLRTLWRAWKRLGQFMGDVLARVVLTLFYFTLLAPFGMGVTWLSDPLHTRRPEGKLAWPVRQNDEPSIENARRQF